MHQASEITHIAFTRRSGVLKFLKILLFCSISLLVITTINDCTNKSQNNGGNDLKQGLRDKSNSARMLRRGLPGEPRTLDPQLADDTFSFPVLRDLYEGLTAEDRNGRIVPGVAESWTVDTTGTVYTFVLRPNAEWSDGARVVAMDFVRGLRRAVDPRTASGLSALLTVIKGASDIIAGRKKVVELGVTAPNENSVRIELEHPAPFVLQILSQPISAPARSQADATQPIARSGDGSKVSNGAYVLINRVPGSFMDLLKNPKYWDASHVSIQRVRYVNTESEATEIREYFAGEVDMTSTIPAPDLDRVTQKFGAEIQAVPILGTLYLGLDVSEPPLRDSRDLRQALSMTVERDMISEHVIMGVTPAYSFVANGVRGYTPPAYAWSRWSREQRLTYARTLYERAGYSKKTPLHLTLYFNTGESIQRIMIAIATSWKQNLGVDVELVSDEFRVFLAGRKDRSRWDVIRLGWYADYDDPAAFLDVFSRNNSQNDPGYMSSDFNSLIDAARRELNPDKRMLLLQRSEEVLLNDYPIIPVYFYTARRLVKPDLGGAEITPLHHTYSKHLYWKGGS